VGSVGAVDADCRLPITDSSFINYRSPIIDVPVIFAAS